MRSGDFVEPATLAAAFEGADRVLVISAAIRGADAAVAANLAAIDAARAAGASRIVYTSHQAAAAGSLFAPQHTHAATEAHLAAQDVPFTALRNGFYASTLERYLPDAVRTGRLALPADGAFSWTDHVDLAEIAAVALAEPDTFHSVTPPLTAPELLDFAAVAEIASELTGRPIAHVTLPDDEWAAGSGLPAPLADFTLGMFRAARRGEFAVTDPTLEKVLGHPARTVREVLAASM